jgi:glycosyltransferase involved in cell wall biosynthesis
LQGALRRVFDDPALRQRLVAEGRARADEFSMARLAERYLELYERALVPAR